jgi:hypothetical protein
MSNLNIIDYTMQLVLNFVFEVYRRIRLKQQQRIRFAQTLHIVALAAS